MPDERHTQGQGPGTGASGLGEAADGFRSGFVAVFGRPNVGQVDAGQRPRGAQGQHRQRPPADHAAPHHRRRHAARLPGRAARPAGVPEAVRLAHAAHADHGGRRPGGGRRRAGAAQRHRDVRVRRPLHRAGGRRGRAAVRRRAEQDRPRGRAPAERAPRGGARPLRERGGPARLGAARGRARRRALPALGGDAAGPGRTSPRASRATSRWSCSSRSSSASRRSG